MGEEKKVLESSLRMSVLTPHSLSVFRATCMKLVISEGLFLNSCSLFVSDVIEGTRGSCLVRVCILPKNKDGPELQAFERPKEKKTKIKTKQNKKLAPTPYRP